MMQEIEFVTPTPRGLPQGHSGSWWFLVRYDLNTTPLIPTSTCWAAVKEVCRAKPSSNCRATIKQFFFFGHQSQKKICSPSAQQQLCKQKKCARWLIDGVQQMLDSVQRLLGRLARRLLNSCLTSAHWD